MAVPSLTDEVSEADEVAVEAMASAAQREPREASQHVTVLEPSRGWVALRLRELWEYRELLYFLAWRDIKVRYKQTAIGAAWAILQPFCTMVVFTLFFGNLAGISSDGKPYAVWTLAAIVPWTFFSNGLAHASNSLVDSANLIRKVYFPRLLVPAANVMGGGVDFAIAFGMLLIVMGYFGIMPTWNVIWLPAFVALTVMTSLGVGLWLSALNVKYRDVRYTIPFLTQLWMFSTPVVYGSSSIKNETFRTLYGLNPMAGVVEGFRWALLGTDTSPGPIIAASTAMSFLVFITGAYYFRRMEKQFADIV
jgi:lipopolysaccharide transport system permease protein